MKKLLLKTLYVIYSAISFILGMVGIFGVPEFAINLLGLFFVKILAVAVGSLILYVWYKVSCHVNAI